MSISKLRNEVFKARRKGIFQEELSQKLLPIFEDLLVKGKPSTKTQKLYLIKRMLLGYVPKKHNGKIEGMVEFIKNLK